MSAVDQIWYGQGAAAAAARLALWPLSLAYGVASALRGRLYDVGILPTHAPALPVVSVGNLTVGGTGKTPLAAWIAERLSHRARTAVALRGYGADEVAVHGRINPGIPVVVAVDRLAAVREARARGAEVVVLDDAFQHRRAGRDANVLLVSAEQLGRPRRLLPAGPWREPLSAAARADLIVITRKSASADAVDRAMIDLAAAAPGIPLASVHLAPGELRAFEGQERRALDSLRGTPVLAIAAIGEPSSFVRQLEALGARTTLRAFRDHHDFTDAEIRHLSMLAPADGMTVCTLKDAVKLAGRWPGPSRLWYLSQQLVVERGGDHMDVLLERVLDARATTTASAG